MNMGDDLARVAYDAFAGEVVSWDHLTKETQSRWRDSALAVTEAFRMMTKTQKQRTVDEAVVRGQPKVYLTSYQELVLRNALKLKDNGLHSANRLSDGMPTNIHRKMRLDDLVDAGLLQRFPGNKQTKFVYRITEKGASIARELAPKKERTHDPIPSVGPAPIARPA